MALTAPKLNCAEIAAVDFYEPLAAQKVYAGGIACISTATGYALKGATAATLVARGVFQETVDNSAGAAGDLSAKIRAGVFGPFANSAGADEIARDDIGKDCYIVDDETVALTSNSSARSKAGRIVNLTADGVYVALGIP